MSAGDRGSAVYRKRAPTSDWKTGDDESDNDFNPAAMVKEWKKAWKAGPAKEDNTPLFKFGPGKPGGLGGSKTGGGSKRTQRRNSTSSSGSRGSRRGKTGSKGGGSKRTPGGSGRRTSGGSKGSRGGGRRAGSKTRKH